MLSLFPSIPDSPQRSFATVDSQHQTIYSLFRFKNYMRAPAPPMAIVYLSLGSNVGDRDANLRAAITSLRRDGLHVMKISSFYETEPVDYLDQAWFLNCVVEAETQLEAPALLRVLQSIESQMGSQKDFAKGPRKIDLDILLYGQETIDTPDLRVPHPRMLQRRFVLVPLAEIASGLRHPSWNLPAADLLAQTQDQSQVRRITNPS
jgi:2-amino-4-hydroxy-6-hydroxymethyldihydropteridine diphosphokinase